MTSSTQYPAGPGWSQLRDPDTDTVLRERLGCHHQTETVACGEYWDAVVVVPLERGLAALDVLGVLPEAGYQLLADYARQELVVLVPVGSAGPLAAVSGVRVLSRGAWLVVPALRLKSHYVATWLSSRGEDGPLLDPVVLADGLRLADAERAGLGRNALNRAVGRPANMPVAAAS